MTRSTRTVAALATAVTLLGLAACSGSSSSTPSSSAHPTSPTNASSTPTTSTAATTAARNPLTGIGPVPKTPLIAVKIDDTAPGRPQVGIDKADIVYVEAVEGGLDRLNVLFGTNKPTVGYVRSTRPSDPELLKQYGGITEAFSGGQDVSRGILHKAGLHAWNLGGGNAYYYRVTRSESDYINVKLDLAQVAKHISTPRPRANGWTFSPTLGGLPTSQGTDVQTVVTGSYTSGTPVEFRWKASLGKYVRYIDGVAQHAADGHLVTATNVIVQSCRIESFTADKDVNGNPAQYTHTVGSGPVSVFRQGKRVNGTWTRPEASTGTTMRTAGGKQIPLHPGNTWVVLIRKGVAVHG